MPEHYSPLAGFVIASVSAIAMPRLMERLKRPAVLGYIAAGVLIGPAMLGVVQKDGAVITWLAEIGKLLFMFFVGFEIDLALFNSTRSRAVVFGSLTFTIPLTAGILLGRAFGYSWVASLLIGSIIASHTLLAYPVLQRLGVLGNEAVFVGAFLAGISLKRTLRGRFAVEQLEVTAHALFIPAFFLTTGFLVDFAIVKKTVLGQPGLVLALVGATLGGKWLAARLTGLCFGYARAEALTMASLSFPQMAATLASAVVGYQAVNGRGERLLDAGFVNAVVLLVIVTCVLGPLLTERFAARLPERADASLL